MTSQNVSHPLLHLPPCGIPALVDVGTHDDPRPPRTAGVHVAGGYHSPPYTHHRRIEAGRSRTVRRTDRPRAQRATGNGCPLALVDSCAVHAARDTYAFDMSILILVHLNQKVMCRGWLRDVQTHLPFVTIRPPQAVALSVIRGSERDGNEGRGPSLHVDASPRPLSAPFPPTAPTSGAYPLSPDFLPCGAVAPRSGGE